MNKYIFELEKSVSGDVQGMMHIYCFLLQELDFGLQLYDCYRNCFSML